MKNTENFKILFILFYFIFYYIYIYNINSIFYKNIILNIIN